MVIGLARQNLNWPLNMEVLLNLDSRCWKLHILVKFFIVLLIYQYEHFDFLASRGDMQSPPPYVPPQTQWYAAPPPAYAAAPQGIYIILKIDFVVNDWGKIIFSIPCAILSPLLNCVIILIKIWWAVFKILPKVNLNRRF